MRSLVPTCAGCGVEIEPLRQLLVPSFCADCSDRQRSLQKESEQRAERLRELLAAMEVDDAAVDDLEQLLLEAADAAVEQRWLSRRAIRLCLEQEAVDAEHALRLPSIAGVLQVNGADSGSPSKLNGGK